MTRMASGAGGVSVGPYVGRGVALGTGTAVASPGTGVLVVQAVSRKRMIRKAWLARKGILQVKYRVYFTLNAQRRRIGVSAE